MGTRGARVEDVTFRREKTFFEILKESKDKKEADIQERFEHSPPKASSELETEFVDNLTTVAQSGHTIEGQDLGASTSISSFGFCAVDYLPQNGKVQMVPKPRTKWACKETDFFVKLWYEEFKVGRCGSGAIPDKIGQLNMERKFFAYFNKWVPFHPTMRNKIDSLKRDFREWKELGQRAGYENCNFETGQIEASNEWWYEQVKAYPKLRRFWGVPLPLCKLYNEMFGQNCADQKDGRALQKPDPTASDPVGECSREPSHCGQVLTEATLSRDHQLQKDCEQNVGGMFRVVRVNHFPNFKEQDNRNAPAFPKLEKDEDRGDGEKRLSGLVSSKGELQSDLLNLSHMQSPEVIAYDETRFTGTERVGALDMGTLKSDKIQMLSQLGSRLHSARDVPSSDDVIHGGSRGEWGDKRHRCGLEDRFERKTGGVQGVTSTVNRVHGTPSQQEQERSEQQGQRLRQRYREAMIALREAFPSQGYEYSWGLTWLRDPLIQEAFLEGFRTPLERARYIRDSLDAKQRGLV